MQHPEQNQLATNLLNNKYAPLGFFLLGLGLAFTLASYLCFPYCQRLLSVQIKDLNSLRALGLSLLTYKVWHSPIHHWD